jgi:hypothetical protein
MAIWFTNSSIPIWHRRRLSITDHTMQLFISVSQNGNQHAQPFSKYN